MASTPLFCLLLFCPLAYSFFFCADDDGSQGADGVEGDAADGVQGDGATIYDITPNIQWLQGDAAATDG